MQPKETDMISSVVQHGNQFWVYDEHARRIGTICQGEELVGFNATTVSVRHGNQIWLFNEKGHRTGTIMAR